ncbi:F-box domain-containing protein [Brazilian cedratvirus IHUMI]|uniref:F-box domain-containing protein n=1 Tax=Brazilian cedratvirus IHUMI TaxID=2126980 RepID=A0A2R8FF81_9VIRU|nr:F-box domain-containing protein [Brazilian cedratvirus IHUMI]
MQDLPDEVQIRIMSFLSPHTLIILSRTVPFTRMFDDRTWQTLCRQRYGIDKNFFLVYPQEANKRFLELSQRFEITERFYSKQELLQKALWQRDEALLVRLCKEEPDLVKNVYEKRNTNSVNLLSYRSIARELNLPFSWNERLLCFVEEGLYSLVEQHIQEVEDRTLIVCKLLSRGQVALALSLKKQKIERCVLLSHLILCADKKTILEYLPLFLSYKLDRSKKEYILSFAYASGQEEIFFYFEKLFTLILPNEQKIASFVRCYKKNKDFVHFYYLLKRHLLLPVREDIKQILFQCQLAEVDYLL